MNMKWIIALVVVCACLGSLAQIFLKKGMTNFVFTPDQIIHNFALITGVVLYGVAFLLYNYALRYGEVTVLYPIIALSYVFVMILAFFMLDEKVSHIKIIGSFVIVLGVWMIAI